MGGRGHGAGMDAAATPIHMDLPDEAATAALAGRLADLAAPPDVLALTGELGTGKTVFARAFIHARARRRGVDPGEVPSPTFTLVQTYDLPGGPVYHFDLYRIGDAREAYELDIEDAFAEGISLIEWAERLGDLLPAERLDVTLSHAGRPAARRVRLDARGRWSDRLLEAGLV